MGKQVSKKQAKRLRSGPTPATTLNKNHGIFREAASEVCARKLNKNSTIAWLFYGDQENEAERQLAGMLKRDFRSRGAHVDHSPRDPIDDQDASRRLICACYDFNKVPKLPSYYEIVSWPEAIHLQLTTEIQVMAFAEANHPPPLAGFPLRGFTLSVLQTQLNSSDNVLGKAVSVWTKKWRVKNTSLFNSKSIRPEPPCLRPQSLSPEPEDGTVRMDQDPLPGHYYHERDVRMRSVTPEVDDPPEPAPIHPPAAPAPVLPGAAALLALLALFASAQPPNPPANAVVAGPGAAGDQAGGHDDNDDAGAEEYDLD